MKYFLSLIITIYKRNSVSSTWVWETNESLLLQATLPGLRVQNLESSTKSTSPISPRQF